MKKHFKIFKYNKTNNKKIKGQYGTINPCQLIGGRMVIQLTPIAQNILEDISS